MLEVIKALNQIKADGVISDYAVGGAVAASFYIDAINTEDVDAFVFIRSPVKPRRSGRGYKGNFLCLHARINV